MRRTSILLAASVISAAPALAAEVSAEKPAVTEAPAVVSFDRDAKAVCDGLPGCDFILLHGDPDSGPTQWFFRLKAGTAFPRHWHATPENIVVVRGALMFNFEKGPPHTLRPGEYMRYQAGMIHWGRCEGENDCLFYVFNDAPYDFHLAE